MTDDGRHDSTSPERSGSGASAGDRDDPTTEEISRTEIAAIRSSLDGMELSDDQLDKLERSLADSSSHADDSQKNSESIKEKLRRRLARSEDETAAEAKEQEAPEVDPFDDDGLEELSDDSLYDAVFGEAADEPPPEKDDGPFEEDTPTVEVSVDDLDESPVPANKRKTSPGALAAVKGERQESADDRADDPADGEPKASEKASDQEISEESGVSSERDIDEDDTADHEPDEATPQDGPGEEEPSAPDEPVDEDESAPQDEPGEEDETALQDVEKDEATAEPEAVPEPTEAQQSAPPELDQAAAFDGGESVTYDPMLDDADVSSNFRGAESLLLQLIATFGGIGVMAVSILRLTDDKMFTFLPSTVAGMLSFVGFLLFVGGVVAWFKS
ncbi:MAG: hypothetical protein ACOCV2_02110 [Persicimonas sp.]